MSTSRRCGARALGGAVAALGFTGVSAPNHRRPQDHVTKESRGFAFVRFLDRRDAEVRGRAAGR